MAIGAPPRLLGEILVAEGLTTADAVDRALARQRTTGELIGEALAALGAVNEDDVARALAVQQDLPYVWREELPSTVCPRSRSCSRAPGVIRARRFDSSPFARFVSSLVEPRSATASPYAGSHTGSDPSLIEQHLV